MRSVIARAAAVLVFALPVLVAATSQPRDSDPASRVESLLSAMGGREAWSKVRFVHVQATHYDLSIPQPFANQIWNDFSAPRVRIEAAIEGDPRARGINGASGWRVAQGRRTDLTPEQFASEHAWWESNVYRTLHRLAVRDSNLKPRLSEDGRLEILKPDGTRLNWFLLNDRGEPVRFGTFTNDAGTIFGPLASAGSVRYPRWGASADGRFRYEITGFQPASTVPSGILFDGPPPVTDHRRSGGQEKSGRKALVSSVLQNADSGG